jgi:hypothetical protein
MTQADSETGAGGAAPDQAPPGAASPSDDPIAAAAEAAAVLNEAEAKARLEELAEALGEADRAYHQADAPVLSDAEYDALKRENAALEARFPHLKRADSPSDSVGAAPAEGFSKLTHAQRMMSLSNAFTEEDVRDFVAGIRRYLGLAGGDPLPSPPSRRSTGCPCRCATRTGAGHGRHARRRRGGRERHRQCPHHLRHPHAAGSKARRRCWRCAARST